MTNLCDILLIFEKINTLENNTLDDLKSKLVADGHVNLSFKEDVDNGLILVHHNKFGNSKLSLTELEKQSRNIILTKDLKPICYHFNEIVYNPTDLSNINFSNAVVQESIEGTTLMCFNHKDKWFVSTRRCIDASKSKWVQNYSYKQLMNDVLCSKMVNPTEEEKENKVNEFFSLLDKNLYYFFVLLHPNNKNIVNFDNNKSLVHFMTRKKASVDEVNVVGSLYEFEGGIVKKSLEYKNCDEHKVLNLLAEMEKKNRCVKGIAFEGVVIRYYNDDGSCDVIKLQTSKYRRVKEIKPNNSNEQQSYLELFKNNNLGEYLELCTKKTIINKSKIVKRISEMFVNVSTEILILYFKTRDKKNKETYEKLTKEYKNILYKLHGIYKRKCDENVSNEKAKIVRNDVYNLLKNELSTREIVSLLIDRQNLLNENVEIFARNSQSTFLTTSLLNPTI